MGFPNRACLSAVILFFVCLGVEAQTNATTTNAPATNSAPANAPTKEERRLVARALEFAVGVLVLEIALLVMFQPGLIRLKSTSVGFHVLSETSEVVLAVGVSIFGSLFELWKKETWDQPRPSLVAGFSITAGIIGLYFIVKYIGVRAKRTDADDNKVLKIEIAEQQKKAEKLDHLLKSWSSVIAQIGGLLSRKKKKLEQLTAQADFSIDDYFLALNPQDQIRFIVTNIYEFFKLRKGALSKLRLGIYHRNPAKRNYLAVIFCYDGDKYENCFIRASCRRPPKAFAQIRALTDLLFSNFPLLP